MNYTLNLEFSWRRHKKVGRAMYKNGDRIVLFMRYARSRGYGLDLSLEEMVALTVSSVDTHERIHVKCWHELGRGWYFSHWYRPSKKLRLKEDAIMEFTRLHENILAERLIEQRAGEV